MPAPGTVAMGWSMAAQPGQRLEHRIGPAQLLLSELLALPAAGLEERMTVELDANAALELAPAPMCARCGRPAWGADCPFCSRSSLQRRRERVDLPDPVDRVAAPTTSRESLLADAAHGLRPAEQLVAAHLLAEVDDLGLLAEPVSVVAARLGVPVGALQRVIDVLRASGSPGICAPGLAERLRLQVSALAEVGVVPHEVFALVEHGLGHLVDGSAEDVATVCGLGPDEVCSALGWIRARVEADLFVRDDAAASGVVDIVVRWEEDRLVLDVAPGPWSGLRVAESYRAATGDPRVDEDIARARRFIDGISRRASTMLRVAQVVLARQSRRIVEGPRAHLPLLRRDVAEEIGVHESTVSRAVAGKHLLLPSGETVAFGALFGAARGVQHCLCDLVACETVPQSDVELMNALAERGHRIARRTVAKYRAVLGIPPQRLR
ncbi:hypothetical protein [Pseudonocardia cypriaca]|uniref:RNA polymerase RpoN-/SigL-like sigma 54 subunit n=1 Tax=Pseudonocardia cypriaca TaxID=882449 RepID=A0A543FSP0_9PSEU|nr:hypothetical protein [Pseudonocardia cypriaca]TQM36845.1 RNA polymerase RpoN-/SigL-like sigma 54 subunit [Pseudonocardia cypriaca]